MLRIGFRPTPGPVLDVAIGATVSAELIAGAEVVSLSAVTVRGEKECRVNPDTGLMVARVWEEARKAMLATQLSVDGAPLDGTWIEYDRVLDATGRKVREQSVRLASHPTTHAFRSLPADVLARDGYVVSDSAETITFHAPDADVLLSDQFAATHCLRLAASPDGKPELVGVAFESTRARRGVRDIEGTLWVDRTSAELRSLEFRYTNLPEPAIAAGAGGHVEFLRIGGLTWLVHEWAIRFPRVVSREKYSEGGNRKLVFTTANAVVRDIQVTGGEVSAVHRASTVLYERTGPAMALQLVSRDSLVPVAGAEVTLVGTDYATESDASGLARLTPVLAGTYTARVRIPLLDELGVAPVEHEIVVRDRAPVDTVSLPSAEQVLTRSCPRDSIHDGEGMLRGRVRDERGAALSQATVTVTWQLHFNITGANVSNLNWNEKTIGAMTDARGDWRVCGVPRGVALAVSMVADSGSDLVKTRLEPTHPFGSADLVAHVVGPAIAERDWRGRGLVELVVTTLGGAPLPNVTLEVTAPGGVRRTLMTGPTGHALVPDVAPGLMTVQAKRLGFKPGKLALTVAPGRNTAPIIMSDASSPQLDTVRVMGGKRVAGRYDEFDTRRLNHEATASITEDEIHARNPVDVWQMLQNVPSMHIESFGHGEVYAISSRGDMPSLLRAGQKCYMNVMIDGVMMNPTVEQDRQVGRVNLRDLPIPADVHGIEVFAGGATVPLKYGGTGTGKWCGLIAIWTK